MEQRPAASGRLPRSPAGVRAERPPLEADMPDGEHSFVWDDGSEYFGGWHEGQAHGRGVFSWPSGRSPTLSLPLSFTSHLHAAGMGAIKRNEWQNVSCTWKTTLKFYMQ